MKKIVSQIQKTKKKINSLSFDAHWYRRVFHTFGASFLFYYMLPDEHYLNQIKIIIPVFIILIAITLELLRLKKKISSNHFFGLRVYEKDRIGSYLYFGIGIIILLFFFPQQIAIPCILCACFGDPIIGEIRNNYDKNKAILIGFVVCLVFFIITWYNSKIEILILVSFIGASSAILSEIKKIKWLDDDFMIQIIPAIIILLLIMILNTVGFDIVFEKIIYPGLMPW